jgi:hypothetical protein
VRLVVAGSDSVTSRMAQLSLVDTPGAGGEVAGAWGKFGGSAGGLSFFFGLVVHCADAAAVFDGMCLWGEVCTM